MRSILFATLALVASPLCGQVQHGGHPVDWSNKDLASSSIGTRSLAPLSEQTLNDVRGADAQEAAPFKYGVQRFMDIDVLNDGATETLDDGRIVTRMSIVSPGAAMISLQFSAFDMMPGDELFIYDLDRSFFIGAFNEENELPTGTWATGVVPGEGIVIEHIRASGNKAKGDLAISSITHGVLDIFNFRKRGQNRDFYPGYAADTCQVNMVCPEGAGWGQTASAVTMFLRPDGAGCTGSLINNTRDDGTPYYYLANHCYTPQVDQWVFYFNYQAPLCVGDTGQTTQSLVGGTYRAANYFTDFALVELFDAPQDHYDVYYAGWDRGSNIPQSGTMISHPAFDVKKITLDYHPLSATVGTTLDPTVDTWTTIWDVGLAEFGSSGASIFDHNKRIVGSVTEAWGSCSALGGVTATRFSAQWEGINPQFRLKDWLDPDTLGNIVMTGTDPDASQVQVPIKVFLGGAFDQATSLMNDGARAAGLIPLTEPYTGLGFTHQGEGGSEMTTAAVLAATGNDAIVDWVFVELRDKTDSASIASTRAALLQRDGDVVEPDGTTPLTFLAVPDDYFVAVKHRNHLGAMTFGTVNISTMTSAIDMTSNGLALYGGNANAVDVIGGTQVLFPGDALPDMAVSYIGPDNDRDDILVQVGGTVPTAIVSGYYLTDTNLDGLVKYAGAENDRDVILRTIGGSILSAVRTASLP